MKIEYTEKTITIPKKLLQEIEAIISLTPGLDFNTFIIQAIQKTLRNSNTSDSLTWEKLKELKSRYIIDNKESFGPKV